MEKNVAAVHWTQVEDIEVKLSEKTQQSVLVSRLLILNVVKMKCKQFIKTI